MATQRQLDPLNYGSPIQFDASGKPFLLTQSGQKSYLPPAAALQSRDPRAMAWAESQGEVYAHGDDGTITGMQSTAAPKNTFGHQNNGWNDESGQFDIGLNQGGLGGLIEGASGLAVPTVVGPALAGMGGASSAAPAEFAVNPAGTAAPGVLDLSPTLGTSTAPGVQAAAQSGLAHTGVTSQVAGNAPSGGIAGWLKKIDPTAAILGGLSMFGGSDPFQRRTGFSGAADPVAAVTSYLDAVKSLGSTLARRQPQSLGPVETGTPHPVSIPGVPFQIGGGLGTDPSLKARLEPQGLAVDPFGGPTASTGARRRQP